MSQYANFKFTTYLYRGKYEREIEVEVEYSFNGKLWSCLSAHDLTEGQYLKAHEIWSIEDEIADRCDEDYAVWLADEGIENV